MRIAIVSTALLSLVTVFVSPAAAFEFRASSWPGSTVTLKVNPDVPNALPDHYAVLLEAEAKMDNNASDQRFDLVVDNDVVSDPGDGESELNFTSDPALLCGSIACTFVISSGGDIIETDVYFDINYAWALDDLKLHNIAYAAAEKRPLMNTAIHELSHTFGAQHENDCINILGNAWNVVSTNGDFTETVISEDTTAGLVATYGPRASTVNDLSVMHWKLDVAATGANPYSNHMRSILKTTAGVKLPLAVGGLEPVYLASRGQVIQVEMTLENRGTSSQTRELGVYWSPDTLISTGDTRLSSTSPVLNVNQPYETDVTVTVPAGATVGQTYWVGAIIDRTGALAESNEVNNAAYIAAIQVQ